MTPFSKPSFLHNAGIYEVNLRQYTPEGTIRAFMQALPRIKKMGANILWFMPIHPIGEMNRKGSLGSYYSIRDYQDINPAFGSKQDFSELVKRIHDAGMKLLIDWVANHTAWDHVWTKNHPEFYTRDDEGRFISPYDWTDVIQLDHNNPEQQEAMINAMEYWVCEFDIDGFRADMAHLAPLDMWIRARQRIEAVKPSLIWLGETEDPAYHTAFDISYAWKWMHATERIFREQLPVAGLRAFLEEQWRSMPGTALQMYFTSNHDENSWNGTEYDKYGIYAKALALASFTLPNAVPMMYSGQEIPFTSRLPFFDQSAIDWPAELALEGFYTSLFTFRGSCIVGGEFRFLETSDGILAYRRSLDRREECVAMNLGQENSFINFQGMHGRYVEILSGQVFECDGDLILPLAPGECLLLTR